MDYSITIGISTSIIAFIFIYLAMSVNKETKPVLQMFFFNLGMLSMIITVYSLIEISFQNGLTDLQNVMSLVMWVLVSVFIFMLGYFLIIFIKNILENISRKKEMGEFI
jgi:small-conductance mechanosensitive channel